MGSSLGVVYENQSSKRADGSYTDIEYKNLKEVSGIRHRSLALVEEFKTELENMCFGVNQ